MTHAPKESTFVERRRAEFGPNELQESGGTSKLRLIWGQISSVMVLILIGAAVLSFLLGKFLEAGAKDSKETTVALDNKASAWSDKTPPTPIASITGKDGEVQITADAPLPACFFYMH